MKITILRSIVFHLPVREYCFFIYNYHKHTVKGHINSPSVYTEWQGGGDCCHIVEHWNHWSAKKLALAQHLHNGICSQNDIWCKRCERGLTLKDEVIDPTLIVRHP